MSSLSYRIFKFHNNDASFKSLKTRAHIKKNVKSTQIRSNVFGNYIHLRQLYHVFNTVLTEILSPVYSIGTRKRKDLRLCSTLKNGLFKLMFYNGMLYYNIMYKWTIQTHFSRNDCLHGEHLSGFVVFQNFSGQHMTDTWVEPHEFALKTKKNYNY